MKLIIYCLLGFLCPAVKAFAQSPVTAIKPLQIGDTIPDDFVISNLYNYPVSKIHLSELKGKYIILDFWSTWCSVCIEAFPKMHHLQKQFEPALQIILVNTYGGDSPEKVHTIFDRYKRQKGQEVRLPYSLMQTKLSEYFPHKFIPHYVWVDPRGVILATTSLTEVNATNIKQLMDGEQANLHTKNDLLNFREDLPLGVNDNGMKSGDFLYRSLLAGYQEGIGNANGIQRDASGLITRFYMFNTSAQMLLRTAYPKALSMHQSLIQWELSDPALFATGATSDTLLYKNSFCYDLTIPPSTIEQVQEFIRSDLFRYWGIRVKSGTKKSPCLTMRLAGSAAQLISKGGSAAMELSPESGFPSIRNHPVSAIVDLLGTIDAFKDIPILDETGLTKDVDLELPVNFQSLSRRELISALRKKGLVLDETQRIFTITIITDK